MHGTPENCASDVCLPDIAHQAAFYKFYRFQTLIFVGNNNAYFCNVKSLLKISPTISCPKSTHDVTPMNINTLQHKITFHKYSKKLLKLPCPDN